jgi:filamentous hemagglutinin
VNAQVNLTATFGQLAPKAVGDYADKMWKEADEKKDEAGKELWKEGGTARVALHVVVGGLAGGTPGATGAGVSQVAVPLIAEQINATNLPEPVKQTLTAITGTVVGAVVAGPSGAATGFNATVNNYLNHAEIVRKSKLQKDIAACGAVTECKTKLQTELDKIDEVDRKRDAELKGACKDAASTACTNAKQHVRNFAADVILNGGADVLLGSDGQHTLSQAAGTFDKGKLLFQTGKGTVVSVASGYWEALKTAGEIVTSPIESAKKFGTQAQVSAQDAAEALEWIANNPIQYEKIVLATETRLRTNLATAMANGDEAAVGSLMGDVLANFSPDPLKKIKAVNNVIDEIKLAKKADALTARPDIDKAVVIPAGSKGNWSPQANGKLDPKTAYVMDNGYSYVTDSTGRVKGVEADLTGITSDRNKYQQLCAGKCGNPGDDGGHLIASSLGGAGDRINIVPQASTLNRGDWKTMEADLKKEIDAGKAVTMKIDVVYPAGGGPRPETFVVTITIGGKTQPRRIFNQ